MEKMYVNGKCIKDTTTEYSWQHHNCQTIPYFGNWKGRNTLSLTISAGAAGCFWICGSLRSHYWLLKWVLIHLYYWEKKVKQGSHVTWGQSQSWICLPSKDGRAASEIVEIQIRKNTGEIKVVVLALWDCGGVKTVEAQFCPTDSPPCAKLEHQ